MSQELLALIGKKEVELDKLRSELDETRKQFHGFQEFVTNSIRDGKRLTLLQADGQPDTIASVTQARTEPEKPAESQPAALEHMPPPFAAPTITGELAQFAAEMADVE